jgi:hypothetical protein
MYAIPAHRTTEARRAMTDLMVVIAGPIRTVPESRVRRHRGGYSVGRMHQMIGPGTRPYVHHWQVRGPASEQRADFRRDRQDNLPGIFEILST